MSAKEENGDVGSGQRVDNSLHGHGCCKEHTSGICSHTLISLALTKLPYFLGVTNGNTAKYS